MCGKEIIQALKAEGTGILPTQQAWAQSTDRPAGDLNQGKTCFECPRNTASFNHRPSILLLSMRVRNDLNPQHWCPEFDQGRRLAATAISLYTSSYSSSNRPRLTEQPPELFQYKVLIAWDHWLLQLHTAVGRPKLALQQPAEVLHPKRLCQG